MSNKEIQEFNEKIRRGLELAEKRMLQEKALRNQDVVVCGADQIIRRIPAKQVIADNEKGQTYRKTCQTDELETVGIMGNSAYSENKIRKEQGINSRIRY